MHWIRSAAALGVRLSAASGRYSTIVKEHESQNCLNVGDASKWGVEVVVREQELRTDLITRRRSFAERSFNGLRTNSSESWRPKREISAINLFNNLTFKWPAWSSGYDGFGRPCSRRRGFNASQMQVSPVILLWGCGRLQFFWPI